MQERHQPFVRGYGCGTTYDEESGPSRSTQPGGDSSARGVARSLDEAALEGPSFDPRKGTQSDASGDENKTRRADQVGAQVDERLRRQVCQTLSDAPELDASEIDVTVAEREVTLRGRVQDHRAKFEAEDRAACVFAVRAVHNQLRTD